MRCKLVFLLLILCASILSLEISCHAEETPRGGNPHDEHLVLKKDTRVTVLLTQEMSSKHPPEESTVIAASDVLVDDVILIRRGQGVSFNLAVDKPRSMSRGAALTLYVEGSRTLSGIEVPLAWTSHVVGESSCSMEGCAFALLFLWLKGPHAAIPAGTLIPARVTERVEVPAVEARSASAALLAERQTINEAKVMVYMPGAEDSREPWPRVVDVKADGRIAAMLSEGKWSCFALPGGDHLLKIGNSQFTFTVAPAHIYHLKVVSNGRNMDVMQTAGFQLEETALQFSASQRGPFSTKCW